MAKGHNKLLGLNNGSLYGTQGKKHLYVILNESRADSITVNNIRDIIKAYKLELGLPQYIFRNCLPPLGKCLTPTCIKHTWKFMDKYDILVKEMTPKILLQRLNNLFLMKDFLEAGHEGENLDKINICRMHLHSTCLSDIVTVYVK